MDTRRLRSFVKIVDTGSITRAADLLNIAQPALSQQLAALESQFRQQLLIRGSQGVTPTEAGRTLYRHAQIILRQFDLAYADVSASRYTISGKVSIGLAPYSGATRLSTSLLRAVREELPGVTLHLVESYGQAFSELVINGRLDMAVIHGAGPIKGAKFKPLISERFFLIAPLDSDWPDAPLPLQALAGVPMLLPPTYNFVRRAVELAFLRGGAALNLVAEIESLITLGKSVIEGLGSTIMPMSFARDIVGLDNVKVRDIDPPIEETLSICLPEHSTLSEPAEAVRQILERLEPLMQPAAD